MLELTNILRNTIIVVGGYNLKTVQHEYRKRSRYSSNLHISGNMCLQDGPGKENFEEIFLEAVDESLTLLGESAKEAIYFHLEFRFGVTKLEIPRKALDFCKALGEIFGEGAKLLEIQIMKKMHKKVGKIFRFRPRGNSLSFSEYLLACKAFLAISSHVEFEQGRVNGVKPQVSSQ